MAMVTSFEMIELFLLFITTIYKNIKHFAVFIGNTSPNSINIEQACERGA